MPRPRKNIPLGLDQPPNIVTEPAKVARVTAEFRRRFDYAKRIYEIHHLMENERSFNASLRELRREVSRDPDAVGGSPLNMEIMGAVYLVTQDQAKKRGEGERPTDGDRREARRFVAERLKLRQGQRRNTPL